MFKRKQAVKNINYFFSLASGHFLTEFISLDKYEDILSKGDSIPLTEDFQDWDVEFMKELILSIANDFLSEYKQTLKEAKDGSV